MRVQLVCLTGSKYPVLPYPCALLETWARRNLDATRFEWSPYAFTTLRAGVAGAFAQMKECDISGHSCYPWNWNRTKKLARLMKQAWPGHLAIAGGPMIPESPQEAIEWLNEEGELPFDVFVQGEGENQWLELLRWKISGAPVDELQKIGGIFWREATGQWRFNESVPRERPHFGALSAYLDNENMQIALKEADDLGLPRIAVWETNRGCPYSCTFCNWGSSTRQRVRELRRDLVDRELDWMVENVDIINFADANFGILPRDLEIARALAARAGRGRLRQVVFSSAKNGQERVAEISEVLYRAGLLKNGALIGLQSMDSNVLREVKRSNIPADKLLRSAELFRERGVPFFFDFIAGLPGETEATFAAALEKVLELDPTDVRVHALALFPNSELYSQRRAYGYITERGRIYDDSRFPDENEYFDVAVESASLDRSQMNRIKILAEFIEYIHFGKILFYVAKYLHRSGRESFTGFYRGLIEQNFGRPTAIGNLTCNGYFKKNNSNSTTSLLGPHYPFGVRDRSGAFRKNSYIWLAVMENQREFLDEVAQYLRGRHVFPEGLLEDLLRYQMERIISFDYDGTKPKVCDFVFDWESYFFGDAKSDPEPARRPVRLIFKDEVLNRRPLKARCPESYLNVAGGFEQNQDRSLYYEHRVVQKEWI